MNFYATKALALCLFSAFLLNFSLINTISNPLNPAWDVKSCSVLIKKPDGTLAETNFTPKDTKVSGCFKWGWTSQNHPKNCPNWRENIRNACKAAFEKEKAQSILGSYFKSLTGLEEQTLGFEGCVESYTPSGVIRLLDWSLKKGADALGSDAFKKCTTEPDVIPDAKEEPKAISEQQAPAIQDTIKHVDNLEDQPSQFYLNKPRLPVPNSTSNLVTNVGLVLPAK